MTRPAVLVPAVLGALLLGCGMRALDGDHPGFASVFVVAALVCFVVTLFNADGTA